MILFNLRCAEGHDFEAWFKNGAAYEQRAAGAIECPLCGSTEVTKAPMAPRIARSRDEGERTRTVQAEVSRQLSNLRQAVEQNCDYVGPRFAEEARRIHYGESKPRDIYGEASTTEAEELREEGVAFKRIPWVSNTN
jgi:hypothetical protein